MKRQTIRSLDDLDRLEARVLASAKATTQRLAELVKDRDGLDVLALLKFTTSGCDPLDDTRPLNIVEQLNQSFTYLASITGTRWLFLHHPENAPFVMNLGTTSGTDVSSEDRLIAAETFAATDPDSNDKLNKDMARVGESTALHKYVFFLSPSPARRSPPAGVQVVRLDHAVLTRLS